MIKKNLYAIVDRVAEDIIGGVHLYAHDAPAVRMFSDLHAADGTSIKKHPTDFDLVCLGTMDEKGGITAEFRVVLTGAACAAARDTNNNAGE